MKKAGLFLTAFVLLVSLLTACGCSSSVTTEDTSSTTTQSTAPSTTRSTAPTTAPSGTAGTEASKADPAPRHRDRMLPIR